jgi:phospholipase/carboxylesterase
MSLVARHLPGGPGSPTLLVLHGRGGREEDLLGLGEALGGLGVLAPRGPEVQPPGYAWFRNVVIGVAVLESFQERLVQTAAWLEDEAAGRGLAAPLTAVGFSNGGMMAGALAAARPDLVGDVVLLSSAYPLPPEIRDLGGLRGRRVLASGGEDDPFLPRETAEAGIASYRAAGAEVEERTRPGGHGITQDEVDAVRAWLARAGADQPKRPVT